ncbi:unnamed protein product, partial [Effrenium voratum]
QRRLRHGAPRAQLHGGRGLPREVLRLLGSQGAARGLGGAAGSPAASALGWEAGLGV